MFDGDENDRQKVQRKVRQKRRRNVSRNDRLVCPRIRMKNKIKLSINSCNEIKPGFYCSFYLFASSVFLNRLVKAFVFPFLLEKMNEPNATILFNISVVNLTKIKLNMSVVITFQKRLICFILFDIADQRLTHDHCLALPPRQWPSHRPTRTTTKSPTRSCRSRPKSLENAERNSKCWRAEKSAVKSCPSRLRRGPRRLRTSTSPPRRVTKTIGGKHQTLAARKAVEKLRPKKAGNITSRLRQRSNRER